MQVYDRSLRDFHIVKHMDGWNVRQEREQVPEARFKTQLEAIAYGMQLARHEAVDLVIHGRDGKFRDVWSYRHLRE